MSGLPDSDFVKLFELLSAFEQLSEDEQRPFFGATEAAKQSQNPAALVPNVLASDPKAENSLVTHIAAAMAKRKGPAIGG